MRHEHNTGDTNQRCVKHEGEAVTTVRAKGPVKISTKPEKGGGANSEAQEGNSTLYGAQVGNDINSGAREES